MNSQRISVSRWSATLLLLAAWFVASSHCALGLMQGPRGAGEHAGCCSGKGQSPAQPSDKAPLKECCKTLQATPPNSAKDFTAQPSLDFAPVGLMHCVTLLFAPGEDVGVDWFKTGPPREARSFAELVLQRSLHSLAPPTLS